MELFRRTRVVAARGSPLEGTLISARPEQSTSGPEHRHGPHGRAGGRMGTKGMASLDPFITNAARVSSDVHMVPLVKT